MPKLPSISFYYYINWPPRHHFEANQTLTPERSITTYKVCEEPELHLIMKPTIKSGFPQVWILTSIQQYTEKKFLMYILSNIMQWFLRIEF